MAQIFSRNANALSRTSLAVAVGLLGFVGWAGYQLNASGHVTRQGLDREQPVPFSHMHHVGGMGLDCRYCHTTVEIAGSANIPPTKTCMNCHSVVWNQSPTLEPVRASYRTGESIEWTRVHDLPDYVYFDHSIHVSKGVGCESCHGRVDLMPLMYQASPLTMEWCLDCHRAPEKHLRPKDQVFKMGYKPAGDQIEIGLKLKQAYNIPNAARMTSCNTCHR